jgi:hypothetical protein
VDIKTIVLITPNVLLFCRASSFQLTVVLFFGHAGEKPSGRIGDFLFVFVDCVLTCIHILVGRGRVVGGLVFQSDFEMSRN